MKRAAFLSSVFFAAAVFALAAPQINQVSNTASYLDADLPNGGIAQGGVFTLIGTDLAPTTGPSGVTPPKFPLETVLASVAVQVTVGNITVEATPIVVLGREGLDDVVSVILPSHTPLGNGTVRLFYNGPSNSFPIRVVAHAFGIFAINQAGSGPGVFTNLSYAVNLLLNSASNGEQWDIWGTGLGAVQGDETASPLPGPLSYNVQVLVGGIPATVTYAGRSGCCAGLDQIRFIVPVGVSGCYVPVVVIVNDVPSNWVSMSINPGGGVCSDPGGLTSQEITDAWAAGEFRVGTIDLGRSSFEIPGMGPVGASTTDTGSASFERYNATEFISAQSFTNYIPPNSCFVSTFAGNDLDDAEDTDPVVPLSLNAGAAINITQGGNARQLPIVAPGQYFGEMGSGSGVPQPLFLNPGNYTADNGVGGADVGPFQANLSIPANFAWTNKDEKTWVRSGQPLDIKWDAPNTGYVWIFGVSIGASEDGAAFFCLANAAGDRLDVPTYIIDALPASALEAGFPMGWLSVGYSSEPVRFSAEGLDAGFIGHSSTVGRNASFHTEWNPGGGGEDFTVTSTAFNHEDSLPLAHACADPWGGAGLSPQLAWQGEPAATQSFAVIIDDVDAPKGTFTHMLLYNIPANVHELPQGFQPGQLGQSGLNSTQQQGYFPACPPAGPPHHYFFRVYALSVPSLSDQPISRQVLAPLLNAPGVVLAEASIMATFPGGQ